MSSTRTNFRGELPGWMLRGALCALSSFYWAVVSGFRHPLEIMGMIAGIAVWVLVYAWVSFHWLPGRAHGLPSRALKRAVWIKFWFSVAGWLLFAWISALNVRAAAPFATIGMADMWLGLVALNLVSLVGGFRGEDYISTLDSFGWTFLTTFVDGALFAVIIAVIAVGMTVWWGWQAERNPDRKYFPARSTD